MDSVWKGVGEDLGGGQPTFETCTQLEFSTWFSTVTNRRFVHGSGSNARISEPLTLDRRGVFPKIAFP